NARTIAVAAVGLTLLGSATALGQTGVAVSRFNGFAPGYRAGYHSSTVQEGILRGAAAGIQAMGQYNYDTARALIAREQARRLALENSLLYVDTYFRRKELNRQYRFDR